MGVSRLDCSVDLLAVVVGALAGGDDGVMGMELLGGEPAFGPWRAVDASAIIEFVLGGGRWPLGRPLVVAVDGRGGSGKSTLAAALAGTHVGAVVVHTDDVAWHEPFFGWGPLLRDGVLLPLRRGEAVAFRPPAWGRHGRDGWIEVPAGSGLVVVEGVGAAQRSFGDLIDASIWVQSDFVEAERRGIARDVAEGLNGGREAAVAFWHEWMSHELTFLSEQRPWERARLVVAGTNVMDLPAGQFAVSPPTPSTPVSRP